MPEIKIAPGIKSMVNKLVHRGPNGEGICVGNGFAIGHRRLSIIDLKGGAQPMEDERGYIITYNGEIYNFWEIRKELELEGESFRTRSDTEVLLKAYIRWGKNCLNKLNGMFAFAIVDNVHQELFIVRDRFGIKPLYYTIFPEGIVFASELPALLASGIIKPELDLTFVPYYLSHLYFPREFTPYNGVKRLLPGHSLIFRNNRAILTCYWSLEEKFKASEPRRATSQDKEELQWLIEDAVQKRTISDVPIGTFLSGGIDSGIITATLANKLGPGVSTFTVGFSDDENYDESSVARTVAHRYNTKHHEIQMKVDDMLDYWDDLMSQFGHPFADSSALPTFLVSKFAREHVKVILSGDGGDEQFGGYDKYRRYLQMEEIRKYLPGKIFKQLARNTVRSLNGIIGFFQPHLARKLLFYSGSLAAQTGYVYNEMSRYFSAFEIERLAGERLKPYVKNADYQRVARRDESLFLDGVMLHDICNYMVDDVLQKVDMMSMAVGLEVRVPFLDHRVVEKAVTISWRDKVNTRQTKVLLRTLYSTKLPHSVVSGRKRGFAIPIDRWFRGPLREKAQDILLGSSCSTHGILKPQTVKVLLDDHLAGRSNNGKRIASLVVLEKWLQTYEG